VTTWS